MANEKYTVNITVSGGTGSGKSSIASTIMLALKKHGLMVEFSEPNIDFPDEAKRLEHSKNVGYLQNRTKVVIKEVQTKLHSVIEK